MSKGRNRIGALILGSALTGLEVLMLIAFASCSPSTKDMALLPQAKEDSELALEEPAEVEALPEEAPPVVELLADSEYWIKVSSFRQLFEGNQAEFTVETNLPLPVQVMAGTTIEGQKPDDVCICGSAGRIKLTEPKQSFVADFKPTQSRQKTLPQGTYEFDVTFYPRWGGKSVGNALAGDIGRDVTGTMDIEWMQEGLSLGDTKRMNVLRRWVVDTVYVGAPYGGEAALTTRLGGSEPVKVSLGNPSTIKGYYFPDADMTIIVNVLLSEYVTFHYGKKDFGQREAASERRAAEEAPAQSRKQLRQAVRTIITEADANKDGLIDASEQDALAIALETYQKDAPPDALQFLWGEFATAMDDLGFNERMGI